MMFLITGQPGASKTAWTMTQLRKQVRQNDIALKKNKIIYESNKHLFDKYKDEFSYYIKTDGSGDKCNDVIELIPSDYIDIVNVDYDDIDLGFNGVPPDDYCWRVVVYNEIMDRIEETEGRVGFNRFQLFRTIYTNIQSCKLPRVRSLIRDWREAPYGAIFAIDEIQLVEPYSNKKSTDPMIMALTKHRHGGYDFYIITQSTNYIHPEMRDLFTIHWHVTRPYGRTPVVLQWGSFKPYPNTFVNKFNTESKIKFKVDPEIFKLYKSTAIDTHKKRMPAGLGIFAVGLVCSVAIFLWGLSDLNGKDEKEVKNLTSTEQQQTSIVDKQDSVIPPDDLDIECRKGVNVDKKECVEFFDVLTKESKSLYDPSKPYDFKYVPDDFKPVDFPRLKNAVVYKGKCYALSQQGTIMHDVSKNDCHRLASGDRPFDYFKKESPPPVVASAAPPAVASADSDVKEKDSEDAERIRTDII